MYEVFPPRREGGIFFNLPTFQKYIYTHPRDALYQLHQKHQQKNTLSFKI